MPVNNHSMVERHTSPDGFTCEIWVRPGVNGKRLYYAATVGGTMELLGGSVFDDVESVKHVIDLPRP